MPAPLAFFPVDVASTPTPSTGTSGATSLPDSPEAASFATVLERSAPTDTATPSPSAIVADAFSTESPASPHQQDLNGDDAVDPALSAEQLAALLALMGQPSILPPAVPVVPAEIASTECDFDTSTKATSAPELASTTRASLARQPSPDGVSPRSIPETPSFPETLSINPAVYPSTTLPAAGTSVAPAAPTAPAPVASREPTTVQPNTLSATRAVRDYIAGGADALEYDFTAQDAAPATLRAFSEGIEASTPRTGLLASTPTDPAGRSALPESTFSSTKGTLLTPSLRDSTQKETTPVSTETASAPAPSAIASLETSSRASTFAAARSFEDHQSLAPTPSAASRSTAEPLSASTAATASATPAPRVLAMPAVAPTAPVTSSVESVPAATTASQTTVGLSAATPLATAPEARAVSSSNKTPVRPGSEKIAASLVSRTWGEASRVKAPTETLKNNFLNVEKDVVAEDAIFVGTAAANRGEPMSSDFRPPSAEGRPSLEGIAGLDTSWSARTEDIRSSTPPSASVATAAVQAVREIREIADSLHATDRRGVEVRFAFGEAGQLSVKVDYQDGVVRTIFRTDSAELREALATQWQEQVAPVAESRPYRVADPVFAPAPVESRSFASGGDASRQQRQPETPTPAPTVFSTTPGRSAPAPSVAPASLSSYRPDTAVHLHAFA